MNLNRKLKLPLKRSLAAENIKRGDYLDLNAEHEIARVQSVHPNAKPFTTVRYMVATRAFKKGDEIAWHPDGFTETSDIKYRTAAKRLKDSGSFDA